MPNDFHFAFLVGINNYTPIEKRGLKQLKGAVNDATEFHKWLIDVNGGDIPLINTKLVTSTPNPLEPIKDTIDNALLDLMNLVASKGGNAQRIYFYFAGHGLGVINQDDNNALCVANWTNQLINRALSSREYKTTLTGTKMFDEVIFLTDCCRNTSYAVNPIGPGFPADSIAPGNKSPRFFMAFGTGNDEKSIEIENINGETRGLFTKILIDGLKGDAANINGVIDDNSLKDYLVINTIDQANDEGVTQTPEIYTNFDLRQRLIFKTYNLLALKTKCKFQFGEGRVNIIQLLDSNATIIETWDPKINKTVEILLVKGQYVLRDTVLNDDVPFNTLPSKTETNVKF